MDEDTIVIEEPVGTEMQTVTVEDGSPYAQRSQESTLHKIGTMGIPCFVIVIYFAVVVFLIVMFCRLVLATEKIATRLEKGISVKKENSDDIEAERPC